ncbi:MAG: PilZ domain-containing protein [Nannocystaceae bacterium]|nr:PilZ domain-containing protein [bacterium]
MSHAYDLTASISVPALEEIEQPANGPGPQLPRWSPPNDCTAAGEDACDPPRQTQYAPYPGGACTGFGDTDTGVETGPPMPNGEPYPGNLLADILEYRRMRARVLGGGVLPASRDARYDELQSRLRASDSDPSGHLRAYHRFSVRVRATLRVSKGRALEALDVAVDDLSAGGVKLEGASARAAGERVELLMDAGDGRVVILPARVAWIGESALGLMFAGAARWR